MTASASNVSNVGAVSGLNTEEQPPNQPIRARQGDVLGGGVSSTFMPVEPGQMLVYDRPASKVDLTDEMVEQLSARRAFEANVKVIGTVNDLQWRTFEMWV